MKADCLVKRMSTRSVETSREFKRIAPGALGEFISELNKLSPDPMPPFVFGNNERRDPS
ncbi:hypothetical protein SAMN05192568_1002238 [Methylobacterium pseudosasicola]|uniref:Uncharacterized protein n=1 Tax=Methylobacterium pseudosasicola TaxID=582667 RepID=A0A1I4G6W4_9HYPH|nr:hypothetical protein SAMN05192568_1002238 [Methylobacterium pseudosasicola]